MVRTRELARDQSRSVDRRNATVLGMAAMRRQASSWPRHRWRCGISCGPMCLQDPTDIADGSGRRAPSAATMLQLNPGALLVSATRLKNAVAALANAQKTGASRVG